MPRGSDALCSMTLSASIGSLPARVGVVGPGLMGLGIAQAFAAAGVERRFCADATRKRLGGGAKDSRPRWRGRSRGAGSTPLPKRTFWPGWR